MKKKTKSKSYEYTVFNSGTGAEIIADALISIANELKRSNDILLNHWSSETADDFYLGYCADQGIKL
jgi:hypothetical protein